jgi:hypothetical protein
VEEFCEVRPGELAGLAVPEGIGVAFVVRGGAWMTGPDRLVTWYWRTVAPDARDGTMGIRLARDP